MNTPVPGQNKDSHASPTLPASETLRLIVHDIRNPLTAITMANRLILDESAHTEKAEEIKSLTDIISRNMAKIEVSLKEISELRMQISDESNRGSLADGDGHS